jgi:hypothetical protein
MGEGSETGLTKSQKILLVTNPSLLLIASSYYYKLGASSLPSRWHHFIITSKGSIVPSLATSYYYKLGASVPSRGDHLASSYYYKLIASVPSLATSYYYKLRASVASHWHHLLLQAVSFFRIASIILLLQAESFRWHHFIITSRELFSKR